MTVSVRAFSRSVRARQVRFTSPPCRTPPGQSAGTRQAHPGTRTSPPVLMSSSFVSTRQQRFACARLPDPHLTPRWMPFLDRSPQQSSANAARGGLKPPPAGRLRRAYLHHPNSTHYSASDHLPTHRTPFTVRDTRCCKVPIHAPDLVKRARRSARSESRQRSWRRQADHHIALTSKPSTAPHAGGPPNRWLGWYDSASCLPSLQVRPRNADFAMALGLPRMPRCAPRDNRRGSTVARAPLVRPRNRMGWHGLGLSHSGVG